MKKLDIISLFKKSCDYSTHLKNNSWLADALESSEKELWTILPERCLYSSFWKPMMDKVREKYNIGAMCQLGNIYLNSEIEMALVYFSVDSIQSIHISTCNYRLNSKKLDRTPKSSKKILPEKYSKSYLRYISVLETWINDGVLAENFLEDVEFRVIPIQNVDVNRLYPKYYTSKALMTRKLLNSADLIPLEDVAEIIHPRRVNSGELRKCIQYKDLKYPFDSAAVSSSTKTSIKLQQGDIIIPHINTGFINPFLLPETESDIYASSNMYIIRCISILPEYLFLYLSSETFTIMYDSIDTSCRGTKISIKRLKTLPIIIPSYDEQRYIDEFSAITRAGKRVYSKGQAKLLNDLIKRIEEKKADFNTCETIEDILSVETAYSIKKHNEEQLRPFLSNDLRELNTCFKGKAYKATLILAGSILEAVLIDWLSEIHGVDYFEHDYYVLDRHGNRKEQIWLII